VSDDKVLWDTLALGIHFAEKPLRVWISAAGRRWIPTRRGRV